MTFRFTAKTLFGAAAMLSLGAALAAGQDTTKMRPRSERRLPISKEAPGEVQLRTDTVMIYRTDTIQLTQRVVDTLRITRTRIDTVIPRLAAYRYPKGFFVGAAGGFSTPSGSIYTPNATGGTAQVQVGWMNAKQVLGGRIDWNGAWPGKDSRFSAFQGQASIQNFSASLKAQLPFSLGGGKRMLEKSDPCEPATYYSRGSYLRFGIYGIGGFTYSTWKNLPIRVNAPNGFNNVTVINGDTLSVVNGVVNPFVNQDVAFFVPGNSDWTSRGGWNAGGGVSMYWGHSELFVEARVLGFKPHNSPQARQVPVVLGFNFF